MTATRAQRLAAGESRRPFSSEPRLERKFRAAQTLVYQPSGEGMVGCNFLTKSVFNCSHDLIAFLSALSDWRNLDQIVRATPGSSRAELSAVVDDLVAVSAIVEYGSPLSEMEAAFQGSWKWSLPTAMLHFCLRDPEHMTLEESQDIQRRKAAVEAQPQLHTTNAEFVDVQPLPEALAGNSLLQLMAKRRTVRSAASPSITLKQLSDCLFAGLGITGETENCVGRLPLKMTPSGGARNPYEAYVLAVNVEGLTPGIYHYSAMEHSLGLVDGGPLPKASELVGGQNWSDEMPCVIFLCAALERTMWKYEDSNAYRVVLIEAGHIGQNIMLAATNHGLTACPTAALNHARIETHLGLQGVTNAPVYALTLCVPGVENGIRH